MRRRRITRTSRETNNCLRWAIVFACEGRARNVLANKSHSRCRMHGELTYYSVLRSRVGPFVRRCITGLCGTKSMVESSKHSKLAGGQFFGSYSSSENLAGSTEHGMGHWSYLDDEPHWLCHSATSELKL